MQIKWYEGELIVEEDEESDIEYEDDDTGNDTDDIDED